MTARFNAASTIALAMALVAGNGASHAQAAGEALAGPAESAPSGREVITIYGDRAASDPGAYSVIPQATIEETRADHPAEILNTVAGVNVQMNSLQEHIISIRSPAACACEAPLPATRAIASAIVLAALKRAVMVSSRDSTGRMAFQRPG